MKVRLSLNALPDATILEGGDTGSSMSVRKLLDCISLGGRDFSSTIQSVGSLVFQKSVNNLHW